MNRGRSKKLAWIPRAPRIAVVFVVGFLLAWFGVFLTLGFANQKVYSALVQNYDASHGPESAEARARGLLALSHQLVSTRIETLGPWQVPELRQSLTPPPNLDLLIGDGICGSYTAVFTRLAQAAGYSVRIAQMRCGATKGCHMLNEVLLDGRWVVMDAYYNLVLTNPDGLPATFADISGRFGRYESQLPPEYDRNFDFSGVTRTNWEKYPLVLPAIRRVAVWLSSEEAVAGFSARTYLMNWYFNVVIYSVLAILGMLLLWGSAVLGYRVWTRHPRSIAAPVAPDPSLQPAHRHS